MTSAFHLTESPSPQGTVRVALELTRERVFATWPPITFGPTILIQNYETWARHRNSYLDSLYYPEKYSRSSIDKELCLDLGVVIEKLKEGHSLTVWVSANLTDQVLLAWLYYMIQPLEVDPNQIQVLQILHHPSDPQKALFSIGELDYDEIKECQHLYRSLDQNEIEEYEWAWKIYASSNPKDLVQFLNSDISNKVLLEAVAQLVYRYPNKNTGLNYWEKELLTHALTSSVVAKNVALTMASRFDQEQIDLDYLIIKLSSLAQPATEYPLIILENKTGENLFQTKDMRPFRMYLTELGVEVLNGSANNLDYNERDEWIGGVHLKGSKNIPLQIGDRIILPK